MPQTSQIKWSPLTLLILGLLFLISARQAAARQPKQEPVPANPIHPVFAILDETGANVLQSGNPLSTMQTCGQCHDTRFILEHSFHADLGLRDYSSSPQTDTAHSWDSSNGLFGRWNPLTYRYLSQEGEANLDLTTPDWIRLFGRYVIGGGPAATSRAGNPLTNIAARAEDPQTSTFDPVSGTYVAWDWQQSGVVEMNCFVCHLPQPDNAARIQALEDGRFRWASMATLSGSGIVEQNGDTWVWNPDAFDEKGELDGAYIALQDPDNDNCAQCHGLVHSVETPLTLAGCTLDNWQTATTGQIISGQKISLSGMNISDKTALARPWDIHAERGLQCTDCHFSLNNPVYYRASAETQPAHLVFDPRRLDISEYLQMPDHNFARGQSAQYNVAPELKDTMRRCESCHDAGSTHTWLPYADRHIQELACEACHIPQVYAPAVQQYDWTVISAQGEPLSLCRGVEGNTGTITDLVNGFQPVLLPRQNIDGKTLLAPYNLISAWYWVYDDPSGKTLPVREQDLQSAWLKDGDYAPEIKTVFDINKNGNLSSDELNLDTTAKKNLIAARLAALGLKNPRIQGEIQPYSINHGVVNGEWATQDCQSCHSDASHISQPMKLANYVPGDVVPEFVQDANTITNGRLFIEGNALIYKPATLAQDMYIFGHDRVPWVDWLGALVFLGVLAGVSGHGAMRIIAALRQPAHTPKVKKVYMYAVYERFWHWLQTFAIVLLLITGLIIHRPDMFGLFNFKYVVITHNILAVLLVVNAALSLFFHLASGEIRQFIPHPYGFFDDAILQAKFYLRGIFKGAAHPFEKTPVKKLNPLQQATYFVILNVLLPLQVITGALMWGVQQWPAAADALGGLPFLAPFHSLIAWLFASFIAAHVYLTTTGHKPLASINAMIHGWEEVEEHPLSVEEEAQHDLSGNDQTQGTQPESPAV
ncbi:MAG: cytochrome b/b6 domain-containing protein [Anaerolineales bacterium]|nr:cytochrome b/b6 domain-containing protein [Anaerolineales bacterium]